VTNATRGDYYKGKEKKNNERNKPGGKGGERFLAQLTEKGRKLPLHETRRRMLVGKSKEKEVIRGTLIEGGAVPASEVGEKKIFASSTVSLGDESRKLLRRDYDPKETYDRPPAPLGEPVPSRRPKEKKYWDMISVRKRSF